MADDDLTRLTSDEKVALVALLKRTIDADRYPLSPRIGQLHGILGEAGAEAGTGTATPAEGVCPATRHGKAAECEGD